MNRTETSAAAAAPESRWRDGARLAAPLAVAVFGFGLTYGVLARDEIGGAAAVAFSLTAFAGSAQFAAVSVLRDGGTVAAAIAAALLLNARYLPISLSVSGALPRPLGRRLLAAQVVVDEAWAISHRGGGRYDSRLLLGAGLLLYAAWQLGTVLGVLGGGLLGDPETLGLDAAFPALFLALLVGQINGRLGVGAALGGTAIALALVPFVAPGIPIVAASAACLIGLKSK